MVVSIGAVTLSGSSPLEKAIIITQMVMAISIEPAIKEEIRVTRINEGRLMVFTPALMLEV